MHGHGRGQADPARVCWRFLTPASVPKLLPLLEGLGQDVSVETDVRGKPTRTLNHLLKVFLIDPQLWVREAARVAVLRRSRSLRLSSPGVCAACRVATRRL